MPAALDVTGKRFGRLIALESVNDGGERKWKCICDCGNHRISRVAVLINSHVRSCGCLISDQVAKRSTKHGNSKRSEKTPEYIAWRAMIQRCYSKTNISYERYGGRGISVCDDWKNDFSKFLEYVGKKPSPNHSLDRYPNNNGNYEPGNVRWATSKEQAWSNPKRKRKPLTIFKYGLLTVVEDLDTMPRKVRWRCDCGSEGVTPLGDITRSRKPKLRCGSC